MSFIALGLAGVWCVALLIAAVTLPAYSGEYGTSTGTRSTTATLVDVNGTRALAVVALPLLPVVAVAAALWQRRRSNRRGAGPVAWAVVCVLWLFAFVTGFSIGLFVLPIVGLLAIACAAANRTASPDDASPRTVPTSLQPSAQNRPRRWAPYLFLATLWFVVSAIFPSPALWLAFVVAVIGFTTGVARYRDNPAGALPNALFVGVSLLAGSGTFLLTALVLA